MADFFINAPDSKSITGTVEDDWLIFTLVSGEGGVTLSGITTDPSDPDGYMGVFDVLNGPDTTFSAIENFMFIDTIGGGDVITTGDGFDVLHGGKGQDTLDGAGGDDLLFGGGGKDTLFGGEGSDQLLGGNGNDRIFGGAGNDRLDGGAGDDQLRGGAGNDLFTLDLAIAENAWGGSGDDHFVIEPLGNNRIDGGIGTDSLIAMYDRVAPPVTGSNPYVEFDMVTGAYELVGNVYGYQSSFINMENFSLNGSFDAVVNGNDRANRIHSGSGDDKLSGGKRADDLFGNSGNDNLNGNRGSDRLDGSLGNDRLRGGSGEDTFVFSGLPDGTGAGNDRIVDFSDDIDTIEIAVGLVPIGTTVHDIITTYATVANGNTVLAFGSSASLTVVGVDDPSLLANDLVLV